MLIFPTMGRPDKAQRFIDAYHATVGTLAFWMILDAADAHNYDGVTLPDGWRCEMVPAGTRLGAIFNGLFDAYPDDPYYGVMADDVIPETPRWDVTLRDACLPDKICWGFDGIENMGSHSFIGGDLLRRIGWWSAPGLKHSCIDGVWNILARELNCGVYLPEVRTIHHHHANKKAPFDSTYAARPDPAEDIITFRAFLKNDLAATVARARA